MKGDLMEIKSLLEVCKGKIINEYNPKFNKIKKIRLDSRLIKNGDLFIAIVGLKYDGHDYIKDALNKGAGAIITERNIGFETSVPIIKVKNTYEVLINIADYKRKLYNIPLIAVTGSVGKTTTKDLISYILSTNYNVLKSKKSNNNHIGVPKTMFELNEKHNIVVMELGMNHKGEIKQLSELCKPTTSVITNIGTSHIGNLGSVRNIFKSKLEILSGMNSGVIVINGDDKFLKKHKYKNFNIFKCGLKESNDLIAYNIKQYFDKTTFQIQVENKEYDVVFNIPGIHLITNVLLAIKVGLIYKIPIKDILKRIGNFKAIDKRMNVQKLRKNNILIEDCYNSSYESLIGVLNLLEKHPLHKIIILGDILELGKYSKIIHKKIHRKLKRIHNKTVLLVGEEMKVLKRKYYHFQDNVQLVNHLKEMDLSNCIILIKGSRKMQLEKITTYLKNM